MPKSIGHGKVLPPNTVDIRTIQIFLLHMSEKVAGRLRRHDFDAQRFFIGLKTNYGVKDNPLNWLDDVLGVEHQNFFEGRATTYMKGGIKGNIETVQFKSLVV